MMNIFISTLRLVSKMCDGSRMKLDRHNAHLNLIMM
jgi:hypothetical protein